MTWAYFDRRQECVDTVAVDIKLCNYKLTISFVLEYFTLDQEELLFHIVELVIVSEGTSVLLYIIRLLFGSSSQSQKNKS